MNDQPNNSDKRMESLLLRWGAEEAAGEVKAPPMPELQRKRAKRSPLWLRWLPTAVAAAALVAAGWMYMEISERHRQAVREVEGQLIELEQEYENRQARTAKQHELALAELRQARDEAEAGRGQMELHRTESGRLRRLLAATGMEVAQAKSTIKQLKSLIKTRQDQAAKLLADIAGLKDTASNLRDQLTSSNIARTGMQRRLEEALKDIGALRAMHDESIASVEKTRGELARVETAAATQWRQFKRIYYESAAPNQRALLASQLAARRSKLLRRCGQLREQTTDEATGRLLERLEVVLTRLEIMDASSPRAGQRFDKVVVGAQLKREIDDAIVAGGPADVQALLIQTRLILTGDNREN